MPGCAREWGEDGVDWGYPAARRDIGFCQPSYAAAPSPVFTAEERGSAHESHSGHEIRSGSPRDSCAAYLTARRDSSA